jgi:hypothetical protein
MPLFVRDDETEKKPDLRIDGFFSDFLIARKPPFFMSCMGLEFVHKALNRGELRRLGYPPYRIFCPLTGDDLNRSGSHYSSHDSSPPFAMIFGLETVTESSKAYTTVGNRGERPPLSEN